MTEWLKKNATPQNILNIIAIFSMLFTVFKGPSLFIYNLTQGQKENSEAIAKNTGAIDRMLSRQDAFDARIGLAEKNWLLINEIVAKDFPRRSELDPRLRALDEQSRDTNMMVRRMMENYRRP